ncbi:restriction endonuclease subunit S [Klebsiella michiganensis]|uniref:restriction endonuclease subunit S n=1 Tax=Klebsiella TaxID=570 RepID=UPI00044EECDE|nr:MULTISPECIES: restriction endonuclease subunit S [Klebsiella]AUV98828.1 type I restriction endonuclease subunit S [Klebsiella oxytoca]AOV10258.1 type I restriction endonuclease subunit S [Klebsiella sp. LTGPAF-6F]EUB41432.1 type I restriction modification DNA specificity domain protein [Klebsiella sp. AS10]MBD0964743.1 restriction endonuclease subunit S [Klebsiella michiganensis]MBG2571755.1 restriction endonuclease subunit S [Klebsiella sp. LTGPAF-6F]
MAVEKLIVDHIDTWTTALQTRSTAGRGSSGKIDLYGIKKLRELILELAVRGKLVPQDPNDEPASELLKRIAAEKAELVKQGKIKKQKPLPEISEEEKPFELPMGWEWVTLATVGEIVGGGTPKSDNPQYWAKNGIKWLTPADLYGLKGKYISSGARDISPTGLSNSSARLMPKGSVLFSSRAPIGYVAIADAELSTNQGFKSCVPYIKDSAEYIYYFLMASAKKIDAEASGTTFKEVSGAIVSKILFPLPPLSEQLKIVSRANELMSLCDQLEQHTLTSLDAHQQLVETLLTTLTDSQNADELAENWARISDHFDTLFTTEASIDALKQTILQLAVMGKLVQSSDVVEYKKLKTFLSFGPRNGFSPVESKNNTRIKVLKLGATSYGELNIQESKFVDIDIDNNSHLYINEGDILIQRGNSANFVGCNVLVKENHKNIIYPDLMMKIRTNEDLLPEYASIWLSSPLARGFMWDRMTGTSGTMPKISKKVVEEIPIIVPSIATQQKCIAFVNLAIKICSDLKIRLQTSQQTQLHLADALTDAAIN